jgi:uncharacterized membrane protein YfcA
MSGLSFPGLAFYAVVLIGAFAVRSAAGFGAMLIAVPMLAFVLPVRIAVSLATLLTVLTSARHVHRDWRQIAWKQFLAIVPYTLIGIGVGFYFLKTVNGHTLRRGLGVFLILYSVYVLYTAGVPPHLPARWHGALAVCTGIFGGFLGALFGGGTGPVYVIYFNVLRLEREAFRVTLTTIMLVGGVARIAGYAGLGFYGGSTLALLALGLPLVSIGSWLGDRLVYRLNPRLFSAFLGGLVLLSGLALLVR